MRKKVTRDDLYDCLKKMIQWQYQFQKESKHLKETMSPDAWLKEYCTMRFSLARRSGHTTMAVKLMEEIMFKNPQYVDTGEVSKTRNPGEDPDLVILDRGAMSAFGARASRFGKIAFRNERFVLLYLG